MNPMLSAPGRGEAVALADAAREFGTPCYVYSRAALEAAAPVVTAAAQGAALWVSWPKKASKLFIDLTEDGLREVLLPTGWVDVKVCAVDADWSGLKFLRRKT